MREKSLSAESILVMGDSIVPIAVMILMLLLAPPALAEQPIYQTERPDKVVFTKWTNMNARLFPGKIEFTVNRCYESIGKIEGLRDKHCQALAEKHEKGEYKVVWVEDGTEYDGVWGRTNGDPNGEPGLTRYLEKQTGRPDRALEYDLGDGIIAHWFTGDEGKSCNNLGFLYVPPEEEVTRNKTFHVPRNFLEDKEPVPGLVIHGCCR